MTDTPPHMHLTADIVSAFVTKNHIPPAELPALIQTIHALLEKLAESPNAASGATTPQPFVPVRKSVTRDFLVCLHDGGKFRSLKRHLRTAHDLSPEEYRAKWGLRPDYPMVAPAYAAKRSSLAKNMGLGQLRQKSAEAALPPAERAPKPNNSNKPAETVPKRTRRAAA